MRRAEHRDREVGDDRGHDERGDGDEAERAVLEQRVDDDEQQADEAGEQADAQLLLTELGRDVVLRLQGEGDRQRTELQLLGELLGRVDRERAGDRGPAVGDDGTGLRRGDDRLVEHDGELVERRLGLQAVEALGHGRELGLAGVLERQGDLDDRGGLTVGAGLVAARGVGDLAAVDLARAEDVLGDAVVATRGDRRVGSSSILSTAPGWRSRARCTPWRPSRQPRRPWPCPSRAPTRPVLTCVLMAASVWAAVGAGASVAAGARASSPARRRGRGVGVTGVVAARSASGTTPFWAVARRGGRARPRGAGAVAVPDGLDVPVGVPLGVPFGFAWRRSGRAPGRRRRGSAAARACGSRRAARPSASPGIDTTMFWPPWVAISASDTPLASMRWRMMSTAWSTWPSLMVSVPSSAGSSTISVPPSRSRPRRGVVDPPPTSSDRRRGRRGRG